MDSSNQMIQKGKITSLEGPADRNGDNSRARVMPGTGTGVVTRPLTIPWWLRGRMGLLSLGVEVVYTVFEDATGVIISRMDGEWPGEVPGGVTVHGSAVIDEDATVQGDASIHGNTDIQGAATVGGLVQASDLSTGSVPSHNSHTHGGVESGPSRTSPPG